jgi:hypothetical protein
MFQRNGLVLAAIACLGIVLSTAAWAGNNKDTLVVTGLTDTNGFTPALSGNPAQYFYATTVSAGTVLADTIPVQFDLSDTNGVPGEIITVTMNAVGQIASDITFEAPSFPMTDPTAGLIHCVYISAANLVAGQDYHANVQIDATPASGVSTTHGTLHLLVHVVAAGDPPPVCYITDSGGLLLNDCAGNPVFSGGEYYIVTNQKKITATNPGQFYYNFVWTNSTGADVTFGSLGLLGINVVPSGANSVHVLIYDSNGFTANFDDVNQNGIPCGKIGTACKSPITVPAGQTLWLTWHVSYALAGGPVPGDLLYYKSCPLSSASGDATMQMSATLTSSDGALTVTCGAVSANGYALH